MKCKYSYFLCKPQNIFLKFSFIPYFQCLFTPQTNFVPKIQFSHKYLDQEFLKKLQIQVIICGVTGAILNDFSNYCNYHILTWKTSIFEEENSSLKLTKISHKYFPIFSKTI